jgi:hypothetical protein
MRGSVLVTTPARRLIVGNWKKNGSMPLTEAMCCYRLQPYVATDAAS